MADTPLHDDSQESLLGSGNLSPAAVIQALSAELAHRTQLVQASQEALACLTDCADFEVALQQALGILAKALGYTLVRLVEHLDEKGNTGAHTWHVISEFSAGPLPPVGQKREGKFTDFPIFSQVMMDHPGTILQYRLHDLPDASFREFMGNIGVRSLLFAPLLARGRNWGALGCLDQKSDRQRSPFDQQLLVNTAQSFVHALLRWREERHNQVLQRQLLTSNARIQAINQALVRSASQMATSDDLTQLLRTSLLESARLLGAESVLCFAYDRTLHTLCLRAAVVGGQALATDDASLPPAWRQPMPAHFDADWLTDPEGCHPRVEDPRVVEPYPGVPTDGWHRRHGHVQCICRPLNAGGQLQAVVQFGFAAPVPEPVQEHFEPLLPLGILIAVSVQLAQFYSESRELAITSERAAIAREIHDNLAQSFAAILLQLEAADSLRERDLMAAERHYQRIRETARIGLAEARRSALALSPLILEQEGLLPALTQLAQRSNVENRLSCVLKYTGLPRRLPGPYESALFRCCREALHNAVRHGGATDVAIQLDFGEQRLRLQVQDNGRGLAPVPPIAAAGQGLRSLLQELQRLGGTMTIATTPGSGALLSAELPLQGTSPMPATPGKYPP